MLTHAPWIDKRTPSPMCGSAILLPSNQVEFLVGAHWPACPVTLYLSRGTFIHTCAHTHTCTLACISARSHFSRQSKRDTCCRAEGGRGCSLPGVRAGMLAEYQATSIINVAAAAAKATLKVARTGTKKKKKRRQRWPPDVLRKAASLAQDSARVRLIKQTKRCKCYPLPCQTNRSASWTSAKKKNPRRYLRFPLLSVKRVQTHFTGKKLLCAPG